MITIRTYPPILVFLFLALHLPAQEAELRYRLQPGETYTLEIKLHQNTRSESAAGNDITLYSRMKLDFLVDSTDGQGIIYIRAGYRDLHLSMLAPSLGIDLNSESRRDKMLAEMLDSLEQHTFRLGMNSSGELKSLEEITLFSRTFSAAPPADTSQKEVILETLDEVYGTDAFQSLFNLFVSVYPVVRPIRNWTRDLTYYFNTKPVQIANRYHLTKKTEEVIIIQGLGMLNSAEDFHENTSQGEVSSTVSGSQTFDFQMDIETGWLKQCMSRQRLVIETTIIRNPHLPPGLKIPSYTETLFEVEGSHTGHNTTPDD